VQEKPKHRACLVHATRRVPCLLHHGDGNVDSLVRVNPERNQTPTSLQVAAGLTGLP
jgi:hypothetical protein